MKSRTRQPGSSLGSDRHAGDRATFGLADGHEARRRTGEREPTTAVNDAPLIGTIHPDPAHAMSPPAKAKSIVRAA
jgi:hypothetical protein